MMSMQLSSLRGLHSPQEGRQARSKHPVALIAPPKALRSSRHVQRRQQPLPCRAAAEAEAAPAEGAAPSPAAGSGGSGANKYAAEWNRAMELQQSGEVFETEIMGARGAGVTVSVGRLTGFIPYKLMDPARLAAAEAAFDAAAAAEGASAPSSSSRVSMDKDAAAAQRERTFQSLVGQKVRVKVTQVIVPERRLICSEKAAMLDVLCSQVERGDVVEGTISSLHDFGALVNVMRVNGQPAPSAQVCLPLRELSWDWVGSASEVVERGQPVRCTVIRIDSPPRSRVTVSLKRLEKDPLKETLDVLLPLDEQRDADYKDNSAGAVPSGVEDILEALRREPGITDVALGRRVTEKRTVSQDLEVWMSKEVVQGGFNLVARAGRSVQEIRVTTSMGSEEMKAVVQRVLRSLV